jgi:hypothetical protein
MINTVERLEILHVESKTLRYQLPVHARGKDKYFPYPTIFYPLPSRGCDTSCGHTSSFSHSSFSLLQLLALLSLTLGGRRCYTIKCLEVWRWREMFVCNKWLGKCEVVTYKKIINFNDTCDLKRLENIYKN